MNYTNTHARLEQALKSLREAAALASIRSIVPSITKIAWDTDYEIDDQGQGFPVHNDIKVFLVGGKVLTDFPDLSDLLDGYYDYWIESFGCEGFNESEMDEFDGLDTTEGCVAMIGKVWFGLPDFETTHKLLWSVGDLIHIIAEQRRDEVWLDSEESTLLPKEAAAINAAVAILEAAS